MVRPLSRSSFMARLHWCAFYNFDKRGMFLLDITASVRERVIHCVTPQATRRIPRWMTTPRFSTRARNKAEATFVPSK